MALAMVHDSLVDERVSNRLETCPSSITAARLLSLLLVRILRDRLLINESGLGQADGIYRHVG